MAEKKQLLAQFKKDLERFNRARRIWVYFSLISLVVAIAVIASWQTLTQLDSSVIWWSIGSISFIVLVNWWYWTMKLVRKILVHQTHMIEILSEITHDIQTIKSEVIDLFKK